MENKIIENLEQPEKVLNSQSEEISQIENRAEDRAGSGSKYGKFKDANALFEAYNNLQTDYTKKCQALSEFQKKTENATANINATAPANSFDWTQEARSFFESNAKAKKYEDKLARIIIEDKEIANSDAPLTKAWSKFVLENFHDKNDLATDENFLQEYIFNNEEITNKIIKNYFNSLNFPQNPTLMSMQKGSESLLSPKAKPKTIKEAGKLVEDMF